MVCIGRVNGARLQSTDNNMAYTNTTLSNVRVVLKSKKDEAFRVTRYQSRSRGAVRAVLYAPPDRFLLWPQQEYRQDGQALLFDPRQAQTVRKLEDAKAEWSVYPEYPINVLVVATFHQYNADELLLPQIHEGRNHSVSYLVPPMDLQVRLQSGVGDSNMIATCDTMNGQQSLLCQYTHKKRSRMPEVTFGIYLREGVLHRYTNGYFTYAYQAEPSCLVLTSYRFDIHMEDFMNGQWSSYPLTTAAGGQQVTMIPQPGGHPSPARKERSKALARLAKLDVSVRSVYNPTSSIIQQWLSTMHNSFLTCMQHTSMIVHYAGLGDMQRDTIDVSHSPSLASEWETTGFNEMIHYNEGGPVTSGSINFDTRKLLTSTHDVYSRTNTESSSRSSSITSHFNFDNCLRNLFDIDPHTEQPQSYSTQPEYAWSHWCDQTYSRSTQVTPVASSPEQYCGLAPVL